MVVWFAILAVGAVGSVVLGTVFAAGWVSLCERRVRDWGWPDDAAAACSDARAVVFLCGMVITAAAEIVAWRMGVIYNIVWHGT